jgi:hypothetical protein
VVILLVETQRSMTNVCEISPSNASQLAAPEASEVGPGPLGHLSVAVEPIYGTTDNQAESQRSCALQSQGGQEHGLEEIILEVKESLPIGTSG